MFATSLVDWRDLSMACEVGLEGGLLRLPPCVKFRGANGSRLQKIEAAASNQFVTPVSFIEPMPIGTARLFPVLPRKKSQTLSQTRHT